MNRSFNQSGLLVTVETDIGVTGIGEGGSPDLIRDLAGSIVGKSPFEIEKLWQQMYMDTFYPPGREKIHGQGAIDLAPWDIKGKVCSCRSTIYERWNADGKVRDLDRRYADVLG
jgi:galactonate dehydratase